jgi:lipid-binding SYLF domain-containing protein
MDKIDRRKALGLTAAWAAGAAGAAATITLPQEARASRDGIDIAVDDTLRDFYYHVQGGREVVRKASGVLVFPQIIKAGFWIGGEYGEGALRVRGRTVDYFNTVSASIGFQLGAQARSVVICFMTPSALDAFERANGWKVGVDGSVAVITVGVGASIDSSRIVDPVVAFIFDGKGLMYNLTLEGSKISRMSPY